MDQTYRQNSRSGITKTILCYRLWRRLFIGRPCTHQCTSDMFTLLSQLFSKYSTEGLLKPYWLLLIPLRRLWRRTMFICTFLTHLRFAVFMLRNSSRFYFFTRTPTTLSKDLLLICLQMTRKPSQTSFVELVIRELCSEVVTRSRMEKQTKMRENLYNFKSQHISYQTVQSNWRRRPEYSITQINSPAIYYLVEVVFSHLNMEKCFDLKE